MPNATLSKSTDDKWKFAYKLAVALVPAAVKLCGFPKSLELLEEPLSKLIEHLTGESVDWLFREEGELEKTAVIIGKALETLLKNEKYNHLETFFKSINFNFSNVDLVSEKDALADHFCNCFMAWNNIPLAQKDENQEFMRQFTADLFAIVEVKIKSDSTLAKYWCNVDTNKTVHRIEDILTAEPAHNHNADYIRKWNEPLCLHDGSQANVTLSTIFVMPEVEIGKKRTKVDALVKQFLGNTTANILLLLGHGGYGKTSFVARMAANKDEYTNRPLHIFRLRNFSKAKVEDLCDAIKELSNENLENDAVVVFDGLDELCMIGGSNGEEQEKATQLMAELAKFWRECSSRKLIVTSRPNYVDVQTIAKELDAQTPVGKQKPVLQSYEYAKFDAGQRKQLVDKLEEADPALRGNTGCSHIRRMDENEDDVIYGSPFILYLICAGGDDINEAHFQNRWLLFRTIFHDVLFNPAYRNGNTERDRFFREHRDKLYYITCCLAYEIYKSGYKIQYFQRADVLKTIRSCSGETKSEEFLNALCDCHALCTYFQKNADGAIEFAHNHVRDFFLCEYILQGLDDCYAEYPKPEMTPEKCGKLVADWLSDNIKYYDTMQETDNFLKLAAKQKANACPHVEQYFKADELKHVFHVFCHNGGLREYHADQMPIGAQSAAKNVIFHSALFLKTLLPETDDLIQWFDADTFNHGERSIIEQMWRVLDRADLTGANLFGADLSGANLFGADLIGADLTGANLRDADLRDADLRGANLFGADLIGADLTGANLRDADLTGARYNDRTNFTNVTPSDFDPKDPKWGMEKVT